MQEASSVIVLLSELFVQQPSLAGFDFACLSHHPCAENTQVPLVVEGELFLAGALAV